MILGSLVYAARGYPSVNVDFFGPVIAFYTVASQEPRWTSLASGVLEAQTKELQAARLELAEQAVVQERLRIARELHDVVAHHMSTIVVQSAVARESVADDALPAIQAIEHVQSISRSALGEIRQLLGVLRRDDGAPLLSPGPGLAGLDELIGQARAGGVAVQLTTEGKVLPLPAAVDLAAYRLIQEALTNVMKHAKGSGARVSLRYAQEALSVEVVNDAVAGRPGEMGKVPTGSGLGIAGMRERVALLGGSFAAGPRAEGGFRIAAVLPLGTER
jgi:signal transduction histidine kinase